MPTPKAETIREVLILQKSFSFLSAPKKIIQIDIFNKFFKTVIDILIYIVYKYN